MQRLPQLIALGVLAACVADIALLFFAGHPLQQYLTENADLLYLPAVFSDLLSKGGRLSDWFLTPAPYFFPDYPLYFVSHIAGTSTSSRIALFAVAQMVLTAAVFWNLASATLRTHALLVAVTITIVFVWLGTHGGEPFVLLFASASHFGSFLSSILLIAMWVRYQRAAQEKRVRGMLLAGMCAIAFLTSLSDNFFIVQGVVPLLATVAAVTVRTERMSWGKRIAVGGVWGALALVIPFLVYREPIAAPVINVAWASDVDAGRRASLEARFRLSDGDFRGGQLWTYRINDTETGNVRALVLDSSVEDTQHVDRRAYVVEGAFDPFDRAAVTSLAGGAAATLVLLGLSFVAQAAASIYRRRMTADTLTVLAPAVSAALGYVSYGLVVANPTRYPPSFGLEKAYANVSSVYEIAERVVAAPAYMAVAVGLVILTAAVGLRRRHAHTLQRDPLLWVGLYSVLSILSVLLTLTVMTDLPVMPRYLIPAFGWPVVVGVLALCEYLQGRCVVVCGALSVVLTLALTLESYRLAEQNGLRDRAYSDQIACIDEALGQAGLRNGIAQYWDAKHVQEFSHRELNIAPHLGSLEPEPWITSKRWFRDSYDFAIIDEDAEPDYRISAEALSAINGAPDRIVSCANKSVYIYGPGRLRTRTASDGQPAGSGS